LREKRKETKKGGRAKGFRREKTLLGGAIGERLGRYEGRGKKGAFLQGSTRQSAKKPLILAIPEDEITPVAGRGNPPSRQRGKRGAPATGDCRGRFGKEGRVHHL